MSANQAELIKLTDGSVLPELQACARADDHAVLWPTHIVRKQGQIVGYASICATPIVNVWLHSKHVVARDSVRLLAAAEDELRATGVRTYIMPCAKESPFFPKMTRLGFNELGENVWFAKSLTKEY